MEPLKRLIRPIVPKIIRKRAREAKSRREQKFWRDLNLYKELAGLRMRVLSKADWTVFNEIFVEGIYDRAISNALSTSSSETPLRVLDLGANVGFFTLRFAQLVFQSDDPDRPFVVDCVEGSPQVYTDLCARVVENPRLAGHINLHHGLVGKRYGTAEIYQSSFGAGNSTIPQHWSKPSPVSYIDLYALVANAEKIDLLKCDIEGSEQIFLETYPDLLVRTRSMIVEVHHRHINAIHFDQGMQALGFGSREVIWDSKPEQASLVMYGR